MKTLAVVSLALSLTLPVAAADYIITMEYKDVEGGADAVHEMQIFTTTDKLKMQDPGRQPDEAFTMIYRGDKKAVWGLDDAQQKYFVMDKESMQEMTGQVDEMKKQMEEALKNLPEAQRKVFEEQMKANMPSAAATAAV